MYLIPQLNSSRPVLTCSLQDLSSWFKSSFLSFFTNDVDMQVNFLIEFVTTVRKVSDDSLSASE